MSSKPCGATHNLGSPSFSEQVCANQSTFPTFAPYSPDINSPIEKAWRRIGEMVKRRCDEINSAEMMKQIIIEEWDALPFDDSEADDGWIGLEALVDRV